MFPRKVRLPIDQVFSPYLSSGDYSQGLERTLNLLDAIYTWIFRYPWLFDNIEGANDSRGFALNFVANNPGAGPGFTGLLVVIAAASAIDTYKKQRKTEEATASLYQNGLKMVEDKLKTNAFLGSAHRKKSVNAYLERLLQENAELAQKYSAIEITPDGYIELTLNNSEKNKKPKSFLSRVAEKISTIVHSSWVFLGLSSFAYWIMWIGYGVLSGDFAATGIGPLGAASYAVPLAVGSLYPILKIRNWWKNKFGQKTERTKSGQTVQIEQDPSLAIQASKDVTQMMRKIILADERARLEEELGLPADYELKDKNAAPAPNYISGDEQIKELGKNKGWKALPTLIGTTLSVFVGAQYVGWILSDILKAAADITLTAASVATGISIAIIACSVIYGAYKAYQHYKELKKHGDQAREYEVQLDASRQTLEQAYEAKRIKLAALVKEIAYLSKKPADMAWVAAQTKQMAAVDQVSLHRPEVPQPKTTLDKAKDLFWKGYNILANATTGIMLVRILTIIGSGIFVLGVISNPYVLPALAVGAVLWIGFTMLRNYLAGKEAAAKALSETRKEKGEVLTEQNKVSDMQIKLLEDKRAELKNAAKEEKGSDKALTVKEAPVLSLASQSLFKKKPVKARSLDDMDKPNPKGVPLHFYQ